MKIGWIGLGAMGLPMAKNVIEEGLTILCYDRNELVCEQLSEIGAQTMDSVAQLAAEADIVVTMLPSIREVSMVMNGEDGVFANARPGTIVVDMSSVAPQETQSLVTEQSASHISYIDAPVSGGVAGAQNGTLTIMVGGDDSAVKKVMPIFKIMGKTIHHMGPLGSGNAIKVVNNLLLGINMAATAEALVLGVKAGIDPEKMLEVISKSSGASYALTAKGESKILKGDFTPGFTIDLQYKDLELATKTAKSCGMPLLLGNLVQQIFEGSRAMGDGTSDISAVICSLERLTGVEVRATDGETK